MITIGNLFDKIIKVQQKTIQKINYVALSSTSITYKGNVFNGPSQLVQLDNNGKLPVLDAHNLTNLPLQNYSTTNEISGLISSALLSYIKSADVYTKIEINQITSGLRAQIDKIQAGDVQLTNYYTKNQIEALSGDIVSIFNEYTTNNQLSGILNNKADLISGKIPASQLPSYVDDVIECYFNSDKDKIYSDSNKTNQIVIQTGKIYIDLDTNKSYRWSGSQFSEISSSLALGETQFTAFAGNRGKTLQTEVEKLKSAGYITSDTQTDPIFTANSGKFTLSSQFNTLTDKVDSIIDIVDNLSTAVDMSSEDIDGILTDLDNLSTQMDLISGAQIVFPVSSVNGKTGNVELKISDLENDLNYITGYTQTDPIFTANSGKFALASALEDLSEKIDEIQAGDVELTNYYTKAEIEAKNYLTSDTQTDPIFTANSGKFILSSQFNILTDKVDSIIDVVDNLSTTVDMSAENIDEILIDLDNLSTQMDLISGAQIVFPVSSINGKTGNVELKISDLENDLNYITGYTQTDPIFTANSGKFALSSQLNTLSTSVDGIINVIDGLSTTVDVTTEDINDMLVDISLLSSQLNLINGTQIVFPVSSINGKTGNVELKISDLENDLNYITGYTQTDPIFTANSGKFALASALTDLSDQIDKIQAGNVQLTNYYTKAEIEAKNYLTSDTQTDPIFTANSGKFALSSQISTLSTSVDGIINVIDGLSTTVDVTIEDISGMISDLDNLSTQMDLISGAQIVYPVSSVNGKTGNIELKISDLENDLNYITSSTQTDPIFTANSGKFALLANVYTKSQINTITDSKADLISGKIPASQLPSYVDDVIEGIINLSNNTMTNLKNQPVIIESSKIYIDKNTNKSYRWSGSQFVEISSSLALGETSSTAYAGDKGKALSAAVESLKTDVYTKTEIDNKGFITNSDAASTYVTTAQLGATNDDLEALSTQVADILSGSYLSGLNDRLSAMLLALE